MALLRFPFHTKPLLSVCMRQMPMTGVSLCHHCTDKTETCGFALITHQYTVWSRMTVSFKLDGEMDLLLQHRRKRRFCTWFGGLQFTRQSAKCLCGSGAAPKSDASESMQGRETSCGYLILNTAGFESGKWWDFNHVSVG